MATILESLVGSCAKKLQDVISEEAILILGVKQELTECREEWSKYDTSLKMQSKGAQKNQLLTIGLVCKEMSCMTLMTLLTWLDLKEANY